MMIAMNSFLGRSSRSSYGHKFQPLNIGNDSRKQQNKFSELINKFGVSRIGGAVGLFIMGFVLFTTGIYWLYIGHHGSFPISILGMLCLVPGTYGIYEVGNILI